ncbi:2OG-Fe(II) oxygenase superfamily protein [Dothidotthia symphoricarpi CBS 119687]|uniref:2OG-Fe(II) oxygenase superfamily protein n=1 Tax=Dothidotthia symphoricarpi CBS 119687 TaxID=1392245 RepID=A0A6A6A188_9PLEO|nr:2OG-Fe(II) oxygenase superfamily protein [Dothidotthia symphoricarpi CBS 119687]KAF2124933.1 2OG-Fe(II) oxygenase superfamily protein [Dothidotthia symphoricarpi CBS 119687]
MPAAVLPDPPTIPRWKRPGKTTENLDWADIKIIDLSTFDEPGGKQKLAEELRDAVHHTGFFSITGTGFTQEQVNRQYDIGQAYLNLPLEEKGDLKYRCDFGQGNYFGYRAAHEKTVMGTDVLDNVESVNIPKLIHSNSHEPFHPFLRQFHSEIEEFSRRSLELASKVFTLFSIILELPEDYFSKQHLYDDQSEDHLRYMIYHPRSASEDVKVQNTWSRAHTDFGSLTILWSQNVAGLQLKTPAGEWKYVLPVDNGIICNVGDTLDFWSAGYLKSTVHRVQRPPEDQAHIHRLGLFYFVRPGNEVDIKPAPSPLLKRLGLVKEDREGEEPVRGLQYVRERVKNYHDHNDYADMKGKTFKVGNLEIEDEAA